MPAITVAGEDAILGRPLRRNGGIGEARFEKTESGYGLKLAAEGFQVANLVEPCAVSFGDAPVPVTAQGRPAGVPRYKLEAADLPDRLRRARRGLSGGGADRALRRRGGRLPDRYARPVGPGCAHACGSRAREIEQARGAAERAVREGYRTLTARADAVDQRSIAREQAGFSAERELICRDFQREGQLGFCGARITEARAASLRARLGLTSEPKPAARPSAGAGREAGTGFSRNPALEVC